MRFCSSARCRTVGTVHTPIIVPGEKVACLRNVHFNLNHYCKARNLGTVIGTQPLRPNCRNFHVIGPQAQISLRSVASAKNSHAKYALSIEILIENRAASEYFHGIFYIFTYT